MALEIKQNLRLSQQLVITPQLQQAIKLLQLSRLELQTLVQHELVENPVLEETPEEAESPQEAEEVSVTEPLALAHEQHDKEQKSDEVGTKDGPMKEPMNFDWENYVGMYNSSEMGGPAASSDGRDELPSFESTLPQGLTLQDHLLWQLHMSEMTPGELEVAEALVGNINEDGYLQADLEQIARENNCMVPFVEGVLGKLQDFDPPGVAARDLRECLKIQIRPFHQDRLELEALIDHHLEDIERKNYPTVLKDLGVSAERLRELTHVLSTLEPKPGRPFSGERPQYIIPDVYVHKVGNDYTILLNDDGLPKLQVSSLYRNFMLRKETDSQAREYIQDKIRSAIWLIRSIHQRQRTLYRVTQSIVNHQREFLEKGVTCLKPLVLRDVAEDIQMHESTISRVTTNKYVQTPRGLFELKFFFNSRVPSGNGEGVTAEAIKDQIRKMIAAEDRRQPLSDQAIADHLQKGSIQIARRTVAKYREILRILPSSRRRGVL